MRMQGRKKVLPGVLASVIVLSLSMAQGISQPYERETKVGAVDKRELRRAEEVLARHDTGILSIAGIVGVGVGLTKEGNRAAIHVYVNVEETGGTIPIALPRQVEGVPVRIIETGEVKAQE